MFRRDIVMDRRDVEDRFPGMTYDGGYNGYVDYLHRAKIRILYEFDNLKLQNKDVTTLVRGRIAKAFFHATSWRKLAISLGEILTDLRKSLQSGELNHIPTPLTLWNKIHEFLDPQIDGIVGLHITIPLGYDFYTYELDMNLGDDDCEPESEIANRFVHNLRHECADMIDNGYYQDRSDTTFGEVMAHATYVRKTLFHTKAPVPEAKQCAHMGDQCRKLQLTPFISARVYKTILGEMDLVDTADTWIRFWDGYYNGDVGLR